MPAFIKTPADEARWAKAKAAANKSRSESDGDQYWGLVNHIYQNMTKEEGLLNKADNTKEGSAPAIKKKAHSIDWDFSPEEEEKLRDLARRQVRAFDTANNHYADPKINPHKFGEGQLQAAYDDSFGPMHGAWNEVANSDEYKKASQPAKWRMQRDFMDNWHKENPGHYGDSMGNIHDAHMTRYDAKTAHRQEEYEKAKHASIGGGAGDMSNAEAVAHMGIANKQDDAPSVGVSGGVSSSAAAGQKALEAASLRNLPSEPVDVKAMERGSAKIKHDPELDLPENKRLLDRLAGKFVHMQRPEYIESALSRKQGHPVKLSKLDEARLAQVAFETTIRALDQHHPKKSDTGIAPFIAYRVGSALNHDAIRQHTEKEGSAVRSAEKQIQAATPGVAPTTQDPAYKAKLMAEYQAKLNQENAAKTSTPPVATTNEPTTTIKPKVPTELSVTAPVVSTMPKQDFTVHLDDEQKSRLQNIKAARAMAGRDGGAQ